MRPSAITTALADTLPLTSSCRTLGFGDMLWIQSGLAIGTWSLLIGGVTATYVGFWEGVWAMLLGNCVGTIPMMIAAALPANKWGAEHYVIQRGFYGTVGVKIIIVPSLLISAGWIAILATMLAEYTIKIAEPLNLQQVCPSWVLTRCISLASVVGSGLVVIRGERAVVRLNRYLAPCLIVVCCILLWEVVMHRLASFVPLTQALAPQRSHKHGFMLATELNIAAGMSWWSLAANVSRPAKTSRIALWAGIAGYVPIAVLAQTIGLLAAHTLGSWDPTQWGIHAWSPIERGAVLLFVWFANVTSIAAVAYSSTQTAVQHLGMRLQNLGWNRSSGVVIGIAGVMALCIGPPLFDGFFAFVAWSQALIAPAIGITLADYYLLRGSVLNLASLYDVEASGEYFYWQRVNPAALIAILAGAIVYAVILNPVTLASANSFDYATASLPAMAAAATVHLVLTRLVVIRAGKGGYAA